MKLKLKTPMIVFGLLILGILFQNCSGNFKTDVASTELASSATTPLITAPISTSSTSIAATSAVVTTATRKVFSVEDYGAKADGLVDSTAAIQNALNAAAALTVPSEVIFKAGTYRLACTSTVSAACFRVSNAHNVYIHGQGAASTLFLIDKPTAAFADILNSTDLNIGSFSVDYKNLPFTQGTITQVNGSAKAIDVAVDSGYPALDNAIFSPTYLAQTFGMLFTNGTTSLKPNADDTTFIQSVTKNANGSFHLVLDNVFGMAAGDRYALSNRSAYVFYISGNKNLTFLSVSVYAGPGAASIWVNNTGRVFIDSFQVRRKPGTNHLISTAADGIHMMNNSASLTIQNCYMDGMGDDAINTRSEAFLITQIINATTYRVSSGTPLLKGFAVQLVGNTSQEKGLSHVVSSSFPGDGSQVVVLNQAMPTTVVGDRLFAAELASPNALIRNNIFDNFRGIFRIRSTAAIFMGNQITDARNAVVLVAADIETSWQEGPSLLNNLTGVFFLNNSPLSLMGMNGAGLGAPPLNGQQALLSHPLVYKASVYRALNPDIAAYNDADILQHWLNHGIYEGRQANVNFRASEYLNLYPDLTAAFGATNYLLATEHYLSTGAIAENRQGTILTHPLVYTSAQYLSYNQDLLGMDQDQLGEHWLMHGISEGRRGSGGFLTSAYLNRYPDLRAAYTTYQQAIEHFVLHGWAEGRSGN